MCYPKGSYCLDYISRKTRKKNKQTNHKGSFPAPPATLTSFEWLFFIISSLGNKLKLCVYFCNIEQHKEKASQRMVLFPIQIYANNHMKRENKSESIVLCNGSAL